MNYALGIVLAALAALLGWPRRPSHLAPARGLAREDTQRLLDSAKSEAEKLKQDAQVESKEILLCGPSAKSRASYAAAALSLSERPSAYRSKRRGRRAKRSPGQARRGTDPTRAQHRQQGTER